MAKATKTTTKKAAPKLDAKTAQTGMPATLDQMVELFLQKNEKKKLLEKYLDRLKEGIEKEIEYKELAFDEDGEIALATGRVKRVAGQQSLVWARSEKALTPADRENLAITFPEQFRTLDLNVKLIAEVMGANPALAENLSRGGVAVKRGTSLQVKSL